MLSGWSYTLGRGFVGSLPAVCIIIMEKSLSDKIWDTKYMRISDVKEAVRRLKERAKKHDDSNWDGVLFNPDCNFSFIIMIDEIFGEKLI